MGSRESGDGVRQIAAACTAWNCGNCDEWGCGSNSAWLGENITFHELDANGSENDHHLAFVTSEFRDASWNTMSLMVYRDRLEGTHSDGSPVVDAGLVNASMLLKRDLGGGAFAYYRLRIAGMSTTYFWDAQPSMSPGPVPPPSVPYYNFRYSQVAEPSDPPDVKNEAPLCSPASDAWGSVSGNALIFRGDRYDAALKREWETGVKDTWFNVACAGTAIAKLHFLHHTLAGEYDPLTGSDNDRYTTPDQRQTMLKLITADYCGTGYSYTQNGTPLRYYWATAAHRWHSPYPPDGGPDYWEAIWNPGGAICLSKPRLDTAPDGGDVLLEVQEACGLKACDFDVSWQTQGYALSQKPLIPNVP
jgi:hypothetical protein